MPPSKRRKTQPARFPCHTCLSDRASSQFPDYNPTEACAHLINTCTACLRRYVESKVEDEGGAVVKPGSGVQCPQCEEVMDRGDLRMAMSKRGWERFEELERRWIANCTPGWRWCLSPNCREGQVHESRSTPMSEAAALAELGVDANYYSTLTDRRTRPNAAAVSWLVKIKAKLKAMLMPQPDICACNACGAKACVPCDRPWHEGETCEAYRARIKGRAREEDATLQVIRTRTRECPECKRSIEKNGGCPHMMCTQCRCQFCWNCMEVINSKDRYCGCPRFRV